MDAIVNRVAQSNLITFNLEDLYVPGKRASLDIKMWLFEGLILKEKDFRTAVQNYDWGNYKNCYVALHCSADAIIPAWAFMLVASYLAPIAKKTVFGNLEALETSLYQDQLAQLDTTPFVNKPVIIKGCSNKPVPQSAYLMATSKLQAVAKSIMYGEACSAVPIFKRK